MSNFPKCIRCGYDPNPLYERAIAAADKYLEETEEERIKMFMKKHNSFRMPPAFEAGES
jgi:hypothetical protein